MKSFKEISNSVVQKATKKYGIRHSPIGDRDGSCTDTKSYIASPKIKSKLDLLAYLHELGHCRSEQPNFYMACTSNPVRYCSELKRAVYVWNSSRILCEYNAWVWALRFYKKLGYKLAACHKAMIKHYFGGYLKYAEDSKLAREISCKFHKQFSIDCEIPEEKPTGIFTTELPSFHWNGVFDWGKFEVIRKQKKPPVVKEKPKHWKPWHDMKDKQIKKTWRNIR